MENAELPEDEEKKSIDPRLEGIVNKMFLRCLDDHKYKQAIGIALETRRLDMFEKTILESVSSYCHCIVSFPLLVMKHANIYFSISSRAEWCERPPCLQPEGVHVPDAEQEVP